MDINAGTVMTHIQGETSRPRRLWSALTFVEQDLLVQTPAIDRKLKPGAVMLFVVVKVAS